MTTQDLKENREYILAEIANMGIPSEKVKTFMDLMVLEIGFYSSIDELMGEIKMTHFTERTKRSGHKLAEIIGNNENRTYSMMDKTFKHN